MSKGKETRTVTLAPENDEYLAQRDNASAVVDDLVEQLRQGGDKQSAAIDLRIDQKERELEDAERDVDRLQRELRELRQLRASFEQQEDAELRQAREKLEGVPRDPTNPAIQRWAGKLGMTEQELLNQLD